MDNTMDDVTNNLNTDDLIGGSDRPSKSKGKKKYILPLILILILALLVTFIKLDIGKIPSKYIVPKIENVPVIKYILPKTQEEDLYDGQSKEQLIRIINESQAKLETAELEIEGQLTRISELESKIEDLQVFENEYVTFKEEKFNFDENVANMEKEEFATFYQQMYPENAEQIYTQIAQVQYMTKEQRKYSSLISEMDQTSAAKVLENLFETDMDIIISILSNMETESASAILEEMDSQIASTVIKQLSPE